MQSEVKQQSEALVFDAIKIGLASPERVREWSRGEVKKPETINYRTLKPEKDGLFCEKIFGPSKDWECNCGKYKKIRYKGVVCDRCGVEVTKSKVRRERMGHIELAAPVSHIWYFKGIPSRMGLILDMSPRTLEKVLYFASYIVIDAGETSLQYKQVLTEKEYTEAYEKYGHKFRAAMGAEAIREILSQIDLVGESEQLKKALKDASGQKRARIIKRLEVIEAFKESGNLPEWMILSVVPVIPPDIRPMVQLDGGRFATSDLNDLYRRVINRNNRLQRLLDLGAPDIIVRNEKRMLQEAVDALIDNGRRGRPVTGPGNRPLKSLSDMLKGKQGRFRQNLLGKRVDYSGRSVIVVGPELKIYQCGLPKEMAIELFKPFVMKVLVEDGLAHNIKSAKKMVERLEPGVWDVLEDVIKEHPVMLNRAPTLHRLGIQAFEPVLVEGKAIKLHPLVCTAYNADFDGDQMAVHVPLSVEAQAECRFLLLSPNNLLKPSDGAPVSVPSQDMVLGIYYLTLDKEGELGEGTIFKDENEAILAYDNKVVSLHARVKVERVRIINGERERRLIETTVGRIIFNEAIPQDLGFVDRVTVDDQLLFEIDFLVGKKQMQQILNYCINVHGATRTAEVLDEIKKLGFKYSTQSAITVSISDMEVPEEKKGFVAEAEKTLEDIIKQFKRGLMTEEERYNSVIQTWRECDDKITKALLGNLDRYNNIYMMAHSGARGSDNQIKQLAGMRGLMADTSGHTIELPIKSNFREGLDVLEYFISAHGARKGLADTALRTADSGYLTRRLVDVSQDLIIRETDCCKDEPEVSGMVIKSFMDGEEVIEGLEERMSGRWSIEDIKHPKTGEILARADRMITPIKARNIIKAGINQVKIRTVLSCKSEVGVCAKCYGSNMATGIPVQVGESVGIIAAQSIGEPGTQLTMRTFHTGGIATADDITQGLPRVEELFEGRKPKGLAIIAEFSGKAVMQETKKKREMVITNADTGESKAYLIPYGSRTKVADGSMVEAGDELTEGSVNPHDTLRIKGVRAVQDYMLQEVQRVYRLQGVEINDKHIEVICRQMLKKLRIEDSGDTSFLPGSLIDRLEFEKINREMEDKGLEVAVATQVLLGITKASLATNSFLSAASFQETTKVLTDAAIKGKSDPLIGLKENVIIGKLIPAGTGMKRYRKLNIIEKDIDNDNVDDSLFQDEY
ncbi:RNA polymerase (beta' subunit) [Petrocella atlantisensis]|uniref:DNA-directed RNA polymerase subunit beta' n=1 Tax=Petrocella atlantisensis TaxID=2173034 RepID=A0A3P7NZ80_9FIRM|nr:DNA-directed RNA polymerase subunit beta' [Petrocella atlantisensis]VDN48564.1 RNA polymerase (beta' subunit) [Petrocella atlantisensis]